MKLKDLLKQFNKYDSAPKEDLKKTEDYKETLKELVRKAKEENSRAVPLRGDWENGVMNYGKKLTLHYNDSKTGSTHVVEKDF